MMKILFYLLSFPKKRILATICAPFALLFACSPTQLSANVDASDPLSFEQRSSVIAQKKRAKTVRSPDS